MISGLDAWAKTKIHNAATEMFKIRSNHGLMRQLGTCQKVAENGGIANAFPVPESFPQSASAAGEILAFQMLIQTRSRN
jgi:hypothetical protein